MKIEKPDVMLISGCALAGCIFMLIVSKGSLYSLLAGVPSGAFGGCIVCIFRHLLKTKAKEQT